MTVMNDNHHRQCLGRLLSLSAEANRLPDRQLAAEVDAVLNCDHRNACLSRLACSCLACEMASNLTDRQDRVVFTGR
jgi:hypothetical protein